MNRCDRRRPSIRHKIGARNKRRIDERFSEIKKDKEQERDRDIEREEDTAEETFKERADKRGETKIAAAGRKSREK